MRRPWLAALFVLSLLVPSLAQAEKPCVSDALDQRVCLAEPAQRIVSLSPGATELLFSAGAGDRETTRWAGSVRHTFWLSAFRAQGPSAFANTGASRDSTHSAASQRCLIEGGSLSDR